MKWKKADLFKIDWDKLLENAQNDRQKMFLCHDRQKYGETPMRVWEVRENGAVIVFRYPDQTKGMTAITPHFILPVAVQHIKLGLKREGEEHVGS